MLCIGAIQKRFDMKTFTRDNVTLILGDCMDYMKDLSDNAFDLAIVDPPYGLDLANMNMGIGKTKKASKAKNRKWVAKDWDKNTPTEAFFVELWRVSKNRIIWGGNYFDLPPCKHYVIWDKEIPNGLSFADCEFAWTSFDKAPRIFRYSAYLDKQSKFHPTQKPITLYKWLLKNYAKETDRIIDTHLGSGSSAIAAWEYKCKEFVGIEIDEEYFDAAVKRFDNHTRQQKLF
jgi:site-specific DNA-methyltransferase (adenine-specific)